MECFIFIHLLQYFWVLAGGEYSDKCWDSPLINHILAVIMVCTANVGDGPGSLMLQAIEGKVKRGGDDFSGNAKSSQ
jgi:hypothetical protein